MRQPLFLLSACLSSFLFLSCERPESGVLDPSGLAPLLLQSSLTPSVVDTDTINVGPERLPIDILAIQIHISGKFAHPLGADQLLPPSFTLLRNRREDPLASAILSDDGVGADVIAGDSIFSAFALLRIARSEIGLYYAEIRVQDKQGNASNSSLLPFSIIRLNQPPLLSNLQAPDTVAVASPGQTAVLRITAVDPNGGSDIRRVIFNSFRPDGSPASGNPFQMYNDGDLPNHGDQVANDDIYSLIISLPPPPSASETYRFEFQAFDRSNAGSNSITHYITIRP